MRGAFSTWLSCLTNQHFRIKHCMTCLPTEQPRVPQWSCGSSCKIVRCLTNEIEVNLKFSKFWVVYKLLPKNFVNLAKFNFYVQAKGFYRGGEVYLYFLPFIKSNIFEVSVVCMLQLKDDKRGLKWGKFSSFMKTLDWTLGEMSWQDALITMS